MIFRPIHHTFGPHVDLAFVARALLRLLTPLAWRRGKSVARLRAALRLRFGGETYLFASGREGLVALLKSLGIRSGEEIIVQAYTCVVLPNAIQAVSGVPVFADIDRDTLSMDPEDVERRITHHTRAVICQHTFGIPAPVQALREICTRRNLLLIEDCAHILPDASGPGDIGVLGDALLLSFGRDKAISGITGGAIICRQESLLTGLQREEARTVDLSVEKIFRLLLYPLVYVIARPLYGLGIGRAFLKLARILGGLVPILEEEEKRSRMSPVLHALPNACAGLALAEWNRLRAINDRRRALVKFYCAEGRARGWPLLAGAVPGLPLQKFPLFVRHAGRIRSRLKRRNIHLDDGWTGCVVCPAGIDLPLTDYVPGSDPIAEDACEQILSLPTHPTMTMRQARHVVEMVDGELKRNGTKD